MGIRRTLGQLGKAVLGERYWAPRLLIMDTRERIRGVPRHAQFAAEFAEREGTVIRRGPFKEMRYFRRVRGPTPLIPMLLGTYEQELHSTIESEIARQPPLVIVIGCAEGYYAIGLARRLPRARVVAFDIDPIARAMCRRLARRNGVRGRVDVRGECQPGYLAGLPAGSLLICDCEGAEKALLDPGRAPALRAVRMIVEAHDFIDATISEILRRRFRSSHTIEETTTESRDPSAYPELAVYDESDAGRAVSEERPGEMTWLVMRPRRADTAMPSRARDNAVRNAAS